VVTEQQSLALREFENLAPPGVEISLTGLRITEPEIDYEVYAGVVQAAGRFKVATSWWLGDLLNFGERLFDSDRYAAAMELSNLKYETLTNYAYVCRRVARSRRRDQLAFGHHYEVAALDPADQIEALDAAIANGWNQKQLREAIRASRAAPPKPEQPQWSKSEPPVVLDPDAVTAAASRAEKMLARPLPEGHPLWRTQAENSARDVLSLVRTVAARPSAREAAVAVMEAAVVDGDGYRIAREPLDALIHVVLEAEE
jgi:hypothetical protein